MTTLSISFPPDFFKEEVRCNYKITSQMKEVWAVELDLLVRLQKVCEKYNIVCDNTMPYGILNAEDLLYDFFKESLERAIGGE